LFTITNAAIVPGTHPHIHKIKTIIIDPQPLSTQSFVTSNISKSIHWYTNEMYLSLRT